MAAEGGKREEAREGGEEEGGAGARIAACKSLAARRPVAYASVDPSRSPHHGSISPGVSASLSALELPHVSVCQPARCAFVRPQQAARVTPGPQVAAMSERLKGRLSLGEASLCPSSVGLTLRRKAAGTSKTWQEEGVWTLQVWSW